MFGIDKEGVVGLDNIFLINPLNAEYSDENILKLFERLKNSWLNDLYEAHTNFDMDDRANLEVMEERKDSRDNLFNKLRKINNRGELDKRVDSNFLHVADDVYDKYGDLPLYLKLLWDLPQHPSISENYISTGPESDKIKNVFNTIDSIYKTKRAQKAIQKADRYARKKGFNGNSFLPISVILTDDYTKSLVSPKGFYDDINFKIQINTDRATTEGVLPHELAHTRSIYNTYNEGNKWKNPESKHYNMNYDYIKPRHKRLLKPSFDSFGIIPSATEDYYNELNENYSDLMLLRYDIHKLHGSVDKYRRKHIKNVLNDRYLPLHKNIRKTVKALNKIY